MTPKEVRIATVKLLESKDIPTTPALPLIESAEILLVRTKEELCDRLIALTAVSAKAMGATENDVNQYLKDNAPIKLSPEENEFINGPANEKASLKYSWRSESALVLMWVLSLLEELPFPSTESNVDPLWEIVYVKSRAELLEVAKVRPLQEIVEKLDLIYCLDWACVESRVKRKPLEALNSEVVYEWHYAINWVTLYENQEWDDVTTDT